MDEVRLGGHPGDRLWVVQQNRPPTDAPVRVWVAWFERQVPLWEAVAASDEVFAANALWMADYLRRKVAELKEQFQPDDRWPGVSSW